MTIDDIHAHLKAGHEAALVTYVRVTVLDKRHVDYIRADGAGFSRVDIRFQEEYWFKRRLINAVTRERICRLTLSV
jgi:hypothetical protein